MHGVLGSMFDDPVRGFVGLAFFMIAVAVIRSLSGLAFFRREREARSDQ